VIVGAGQVIQHPGSHDEDRRDPIALAVEALRRAGEDSGVGEKLLRRADSVRHVATTCWPYKDEAALVATELGASPRETARTVMFGGDGPGRLLGDTARAIAAGELDVALMSGSEAMASLRCYQRAGEMPSWQQQDTDDSPTAVLGSDRLPNNDAETTVGLMAPIYNYAFLETAVRARTGADPDQHLRSIAELWSRFSGVAAQNPYAALPTRRTPEELMARGEGNRLVSVPYPKLLTANIGVDQATGLILCSAQAAQDAGVPRDRWVFVWASAYAHDEWFLSERVDLAASPAIAAIGDAALDHAGVSIDDIAHIDLYSCFPSAVQIAASELGLRTDDESRPLTVTGGLTFAGGPGNNYTSHAIAALTGRLREDPDGVGLATALGWYVTKHAIGVYSATPPARSFRDIGAQELVERRPPREASADYAGPATLEAYTVPFASDGTPEAAIVAALTADGTRALVRTTDEPVIEAMLESDPLGWPVTVAGPDRLEAGHGVAAGGK
jgi:acetyl-CoA C-acetyltransferase